MPTYLVPFLSKVKLFYITLGGSVKLITIDEISKANEVLSKLMTQRWFSQELFTIKWWGLAGYLVLSYVLCFKLLDKKRLVELLLYGSLASVFSVVLDIFLENRNLFLYKARLLPMIPSIFIYDITALPLYYMVLYQHAATWKKYLCIETFLSFISPPKSQFISIQVFDCKFTCSPRCINDLLLYGVFNCTFRTKLIQSSWNLFCLLIVLTFSYYTSTSKLPKY
jgi:hypothetical protein